MAVKWFTLEEIEKMKKQLRDQNIVQEIKDYKAKKIYPLEITNKYTEQFDK